MPDLVLPKLGLTMTEGRLAEWRVRPGDRVEAGAVLFVVETDKIANEIEAPAAGEIGEILVAEGEIVPVGTPLARWSGPGLALEEPVETPAEAPAPLAAGRRIVATPLARRLARQRGIALGTLRGSGPKGRIKAADVPAAAPAAAAPAMPKPAARAPSSAGPTPVGERRAANALEALAAQRLVAAKTEAPHFYLAATAEVTRLQALREDLRDDTAADNTAPTLTHFIIAAVARALADLPWANRIWLDGEIIAFDRIDIGVAADTPRGLIVPMLRDVGRLALDGIARGTAALVERTRRGQLSPDDLAGGAIAVSNLGMHGIDLVVPILNPPQAAILGVGRSRGIFRPNRNGAPLLAQELGLVLSCDHRILDGVKGATLLRRILTYLEHPGRLMGAPAGSSTTGV